MVSVACEVEAEADERALRETLSTVPDGLRAGVANVLVRAAADACDDALATLLREPIQFASGKAELQAASFPLLDRIADASVGCPGILRIEGHTDASGGLDMNLALSAARAESVRDALVARAVDQQRLTTVGHGPHQPVADNATAEGRAANRRIEIEVVRPSDF